MLIYESPHSHLFAPFWLREKRKKTNKIIVELGFEEQ
jgi:hypothetical protein